MPRTSQHYSKLRSVSHRYIYTHTHKNTDTYIAFFLCHQKECTHSHSGSLFSAPCYWQQRRITKKKSSLVNIFLSSQAACNKYPLLNSLLRVKKGRTDLSHPIPLHRTSTSHALPQRLRTRCWPQGSIFTLELTQQLLQLGLVYIGITHTFHTLKTISGKEILKIIFKKRQVD